MQTWINFEDDQRNIFIDTKSIDTTDKNAKKFYSTELNGVCNKAVKESWYEYQSLAEITLIKTTMLLKSAYRNSEEE
jgi:hypothetical protein